jgi:hypothetical protein
MTPYVLFDQNTGQIVHTHQEVALYGEPFRLCREELMATLGDRIDPENLDVLEVDRDHHLLRRSTSLDDGKELYGDLQERVLSERAGTKLAKTV